MKNIAFIEGINDYFWKRTKPPAWMDKAEKAEWKRGQEVAKKSILSPSVNG